MNNQKMDELLNVLRDKGVNKDEIAKIRLELLQQAYESFMKDALQSLTDEDLQKIEDSETQEAANEALKTIYQEKTGKDAEEEMKKIIDQKVDELIAKYKNEPQSGNLSDASNNTPSETAEIHKAEDELHKISEESGNTVVATSPTEDHDPVKTADPTNWQ